MLNCFPLWGIYVSVRLFFTSLPMQNLNIMNELTCRLVMNGVAKKELDDKYKKELEKTYREQAIALDRVALLEEKVSELEAINTTI